MSGLELSWSSCYPHIFEHFIKVCHEEVNLCFNAANEMFNIWTREWGNIAKAMIKAYINTTINISSATTLTSFYLLNSTARVITITPTKQQSVMSGLSVCLVSHNLLYSGLKKAHLKQWNYSKKSIVWQLFFSINILNRAFDHIASYYVRGSEGCMSWCLKQLATQISCLASWRIQ